MAEKSAARFYKRTFRYGCFAAENPAASLTAEFSAGNVWNEPGFRELIKRIVEHYNREADENKTERIENFCPHMVRHTYTSLAYSVGADVKIVSQNLGHASTAVTLDTYTHLTEDKKREQKAIAQTIKIS